MSISKHCVAKEDGVGKEEGAVLHPGPDKADQVVEVETIKRPGNPYGSDMP